MNPSDAKSISVSPPPTYSMNKIHVPPKVLMPPVFHPAPWQRAKGRDGGSSSSLEESQGSDWESLVGERQRILENEELESLEGDSLEELSLEEGDESGTSAHGKQNSDGSGRKKQPVDKYFSLRYNPHWKKNKNGAEFLGAEEESQGSGGSSVDFSLDSFYLHSDGSSEKNQQEARTEDSLSEFGSELFSFPEQNLVVSNGPVGPQPKRKEAADGFHSKANPPQIHQNQPQRAKKNFVKKNKRTLGLQTEKTNSYLQLYNKKQQILQGQVTDPEPDDEEPLQSIPPLQTAKMEPEDKWYPKGQQLKEQHKKFPQRNKVESRQSLSGKALPRNDGQQPPAGAAEAKSWHPRQQQTPGSQAVPTAGEQNSRALQECLYPASSLGPDTAAKSKTCLSVFPNSVNPDFATSSYPFHPAFHQLNPAEVIHPVYPSKENKKYQNSPKGIPAEQQHLTNHIPGQHLARDNSTSGQARPKVRNNSSDFNVNFQEWVKDQVPLQDFKNHIHEDNSSSTASCRTSQFTQMEQQQPGMCGWRGDHFADKWLLSLFPPALAQVQRSSQGHPGGGEGNPGKMRQSSSEGSLMQMEKQNQPKGRRKLGGSNVCINLSVKLGGLGPDYEAIKEKKQKLKLQKEYSRQIKEYNMKNITLVQRLPTKAQAVSSVSRQKALEYAKKIPKPKTFITKQAEQEVREEKVLPQAPNGTSLPQIPSLETLWNRHEKEREVVAAFKALHIL